MAEQRTRLRVPAMDCPVEEKQIRERLAGFPGVHRLEFDLVGRTLALTHAPEALGGAREALAAAGFPSEVLAAPPAAQREADKPGVPAHTWWRIGIAGAAAIGSEIAQWLSGGNTWLVVALAFGAILLGGLETYKKGLIALRHGKLNINALMSVAVTGGLAIGEFPEAAVVMVLFALAELIEALSFERARRSIRGLLQMAPETALVRTDGGWTERPSAEVPAGSIVRVRPGGRVPLDGVVTAGRSAVNQAPITGESMPVDKAPGDPVFAGTINESAEIELRTTAAAGGTTLARIIRAVEEAQASRAPTQRFVDAFARIYTPIVFAGAVLVAVVPPLFFGAEVIPWLYKALVLLVIACPCALVISTPVTVVSGLAAAARRGILVKGGAYLELARKIKRLALDKTGTLTFGKPSVTRLEPLTSVGGDEALRLAASLAIRSDHPVSRAIVEHWKRAGGAAAIEVESFNALPGRGVEGRIGGQEHYLGNHRLAHELGVCGPELEARLEAVEIQGMTALVLATRTEVIAAFAVADTLRDTSRAAIADLHELGVRVTMLTGDNAHTARAIAKASGIDDARGDLLPQDKVRAIEDIKKHGAVGMVGDGINDAPALAKSDLGIAMGAAGSDTAIETADVALMDDDLRKVPALIRLSRRTHAILVQNITLALGIKAVFLVLALAGAASMWMAVFADMGASLLVVANGLRLIRS